MPNKNVFRFRKWKCFAFVCFSHNDAYNFLMSSLFLFFPDILVVHNIYIGIYRFTKLRHFIDISTLYECRCQKTVSFQSKCESNVSPSGRRTIHDDCEKGPRFKVCLPPSSTLNYYFLSCLVFCGGVVCGVFRSDVLLLLWMVIVMFLVQFAISRSLDSGNFCVWAVVCDGQLSFCETNKQIWKRRRKCE